MRSITLRARQAPSITSAIPCRRSRPACTAPSTFSAWRNDCVRRYSKRRPARSTVIRSCIRRRNRIGGHVTPIGRRSCYDEGKRCAETLFFNYHQQHGGEIKVARIFNTYGPYMQRDDGRVVSNFIVQALKNQPITLYGDGSQTRSFCYVSDLIEGIVRLMDTAPEVTGPMNLGNPTEHTVRDLAQLIIELTHSRSKLVFRPLPCDDPRQRRPDIRLAQRTLNWKPQVQLRDGLLRTIAYFDELLGSESKAAQQPPVQVSELRPLPIGTPAQASI